MHLRMVQCRCKYDQNVTCGLVTVYNKDSALQCILHAVVFLFAGISPNKCQPVRY